MISHLKTRHIGIVACSAEGAALCYQTICREAGDSMGVHFHPEVSMHTHSLGEYMIHIKEDDWVAVARLMMSSANKLKKAGAEFFICPDNTIHQAFPYLKDQGANWLHIASVVSARALEQKFIKLGILGIKYLMEGPVYQNVLKPRGLILTIPQKSDREQINKIIFKELVRGIIRPDSRLYFNEVIERLKNKGCEAVVLGCTEIPLLVLEKESPLPVLDSTRLLARAAIEFALH